MIKKHSIAAIVVLATAGPALADTNEIHFWTMMNARKTDKPPGMKDSVRSFECGSKKPVTCSVIDGFSKIDDCRFAEDSFNKSERPGGFGFTTVYDVRKMRKVEGGKVTIVDSQRTTDGIIITGVEGMACTRGYVLKPNGGLIVTSDSCKSRIEFYPGRGEGETELPKPDAATAIANFSILKKQGCSN